MKTISASILTVCAVVAMAFAYTPSRAAAADAAKPASVSQALKQLEKDWGAAEQAADADKLGQILADDWVAYDPEGKKSTKAEFLAGMKAGKMTLQSMEFGAMDVKVLGNVGVVQGSDTEKSTYDGKDSSGKYIWTDVFVKRDGKWVAVRSHVSMVK